MEARGRAVRLYATALGLLCLALFALAGPAGAQTDEEITAITFESVSLPNSAELSGQTRSFIEAGGDYRYVAFDADVLMDDLQASSTIDLQLFSNKSFALTVTSSRDGVAGSRFWAAEGQGVAATFTELNGVLVAHIVDLDATTRYQISSIDGGAVHIIAEDKVVYDPELEVDTPPRDDPDSAPAIDADGAATGDTADAVAGDTPQVDVLAWYDQAAVAIWGSPAASEAAIAASYNNGNNVALQSGAVVTYNVVEIDSVTWTAPASAVDAIVAVRSQTDGIMDEVHAARDAAGADLVAILGNLTGGCGVGYVPNVLPSPATSDLGFTYTDAACVGGNLTLVHETGHNLGASHDIGASQPGPGLFSYSQGYVNPGVGYRTVMSYTTACPGCLRVGYFSNPTATYLGNPTGDAGKDNARTLTETAAGVASYRASADTTDPDTAISLPAANATVTGDPIALSGTATDNVGVTRVRLTIYETGGYATWNGSAFTTAFSTVDATLASPGSPSTGWSYDMAAPPDTQVVFTAVAYDAPGNFDGTQSWRLFNIANDNVAPDAAITGPPAGSTESGSTVTLDGTATDNTAVTRVRLTIYETGGFATWNGSSFTAPFTTVDASLTPSAGGVDWSYDMVSPPDGEVVFTALAYDAAGNTDPTQPWRLFDVDSGADVVAPDATIINPPAGAGVVDPIVVLDGTATDDVGVTRVRLTIYNTANFDTWNGTAFTSAFTTVDATLTPSASGVDWSYSMNNPPIETEVVFTAVAFDAAGNFDQTQPWRLFDILPS